MKKRLAQIRENVKNYIVFFIPWIVTSWLLSVFIVSVDVFVLSYYNAFGYQFSVSDLLKAWILNFSLFSFFWFLFLTLFFVFRKRFIKVLDIFLWMFFVVYALLSISFSYYTAFSELLPDSLIFSYNSQNASMLFSTYAYLFFPVFSLFLGATIFLWLSKWLVRKYTLKIFRFVLVCFLVFTIVPFRCIIVNNDIFDAKKIVYENKVLSFTKSVLRDDLSTSSDLTVAKKIIENEYKREPVISGQFPLLRYRDSSDVLGSFFNSFDGKPNLVFIIVESLGRNYSGPDALYGSFTPFLDSLAEHSLYWYNFLATSGRTFEVLPSVFASVPYGKSGFNLLADSFPIHTSLLRNLKHNGYFISFFYGGWIHFDNMASFLEFNHVDYIIKAFPKHYKKMGNEQFSWGYDDRTLFNHSLKVLDSFPKVPRVDIYLTLSNHNPWEYVEIGKYEKKLEQYFAANPELWTKQTNYFNKKRFATVLYTDDVLRQFFNEYRKRPEYDNTIFIITGDHGLSYDQNLALKKFHVPLIIYSPKLLKSAVFKGVCSHLDIAPTLEALLKKSAGLKFPKWTCYLGYRLDTSKYFKINKTYTFIWENKTYPDVLYSDYYLYKDSLFTVSDNFVQRTIMNISIKQELSNKRTAMIAMHKSLPVHNKILPFSTFLKEYALQIYPICGKKSNIEQCIKYDVSEINENNEFKNLFGVTFKQNNFALFYVNGSIQCQLTSEEASSIKLVFEAKDSTLRLIGWQSYEIELDPGEVKSINLTRYFILKEMNTFVPIKYINAYFWNEKKISAKVQKLNLNIFIE